MLITLYGINNIGKTTQANRIVERLQNVGKRATYVKYPVYSMEPSGVFLDHILRSGNPQHLSEEELQMWFTLNRYQFQPHLMTLMEGDGWVVAEDYIGTGIAWGVAKGADLNWLCDMNQYLVREDLAILMDGKRSVDAKEHEHLHERDDALVEKCRGVFLDLVSKFHWQVVQVSEVWDETTQRVWEKIEPML